MTTAAPNIKIYDTGDYAGQVSRAGDLLRGGGVVVLPTETVYGAAALLTHPTGLSRLRSLEPPMTDKPPIVHLASLRQALRFISDPGELGGRLMRKLWPGPVALIFHVEPDRQAEVAADLGLEPADIYDSRSITLRCPSDPVAADILAAAREPVVIRRVPGSASSDATKPAIITEAWADKVDLVIDAGPPRYQKPSTIVQVKGDRYEIVRAGVYDQRIIERMLRTTILFVCSGNTCRSPMAEAIARQLLARRLGVRESQLEDKGITVISAGTFAMPGARATPAAVAAGAQLGLDLSTHHSRPLTVELIHQADVIYTMSGSHAAAVRAIAPAAADKVMPLDPDADVEDPIGGDVSVYASLAESLRTLIDRRLSERPVG